MRNFSGSARRAAAAGHVAWVYGRLAAAFRTLGGRILVLRYHAIGRPEDVAAYASAGISVTPERFEQHVAFLTRRYEIVDLDTALARVRGEARAAKPGVVITFDDGYRDNFDHGLPILSRHGATGTFYVVGGSVWPAPPVWTVRMRHLLRTAPATGARDGAASGIDLSDAASRERTARALTRRLRALPAEERERRLAEIAAAIGGDALPASRVMMDESEVRAMTAGGLTIGAHTLTHPLLPEVPREEARREIVEGKNRLERIVGRAVAHLSYPNPGSGPQHDDVVRGMAREAGYASASTSTGGLVTRASDPFALPRVGITPGYQERLLFRLLGEG